MDSCSPAIATNGSNPQHHQAFCLLPTRKRIMGTFTQGAIVADDVDPEWGAINLIHSVTKMVGYS